MLHDDVGDEEERGPRSRRHAVHAVTEVAAPIQHHYSTRRAQAHDVAAVAEVVAAEATAAVEGGVDGTAGVEEAGGEDVPRQRTTIRLRRN